MTGDERDSVQPAVTRTSINRRTWSFAQVVGGVIGIFFLVMGLVALVRGGFGNLTSPEVSVAGFGHTPLFAILEAAVGAMWVGAASGPWSARAGMLQLAVLSFVFGLVVVIEPGALSGSLGVSESTGWLYAAVGVLAGVVAWAAPVVISERVSGEAPTGRTEDPPAS